MKTRLAFLFLAVVVALPMCFFALVSLTVRPTGVETARLQQAMSVYLDHSTEEFSARFGAPTDSAYFTDHQETIGVWDYATKDGLVRITFAVRPDRILRVATD